VTTDDSDIAEARGRAGAAARIASLATAPGPFLVGGPWQRVFPGEKHQLAALRRWVESVLPDCPERYDVACVTTELGTNAIRHTASGRGGWFGVEITCYESIVRIAVTDCGAPGEPRMIDDPAAEHGRGLQVVRGLSVRTGTCGDQDGRLVWADVGWDMRLRRSADVEPTAPVAPAAAGRAAVEIRFRQDGCISVGAPARVQ
jgi:hypothetical protein